MCAEQKQHFVRDFLQFWRFWHVIKQVGMSQSATPATQNDMTTCLETFEMDRFCTFPHSHGEATGKTRDSRRNTWAQKNEHFVRDVLQFWRFQHGIKQVVGMSQSATPDAQNDMTTCLETYEKGRFCSFPHTQWIECLKLFLTFNDVRNICYIALRIAWETTFIYDFCLVPIYGFPPLSQLTNPNSKSSFFTLFGFRR